MRNVAKMALANDDDVIKTFPSDRADQPLRISVLPRRPRRDLPFHAFFATGTGMPGIFTLTDPIMVRPVKNSVFQSSPPKPILVVAGWPCTMRPSFLPFGSST